MKNKELEILNILRGVSALLVLFYHFFFFFFYYQDVWTIYLQVDPLDVIQPFYIQSLLDFPIDIGHLAVAYFFLITGFLIQGTLSRYDSLERFLKHKVIRLWPTYAVCLGVGLLFLMGCKFLIDRPFLISLDHILACLFWVRDICGYPFIDGAVWTLEIQLKFYIFTILVWSACKKGFLEKACLIAILLSLALYGIYSFAQGEEFSWYYLVPIFRKTLKFFMLMLSGACIYAWFKGEISKTKALFLCGILLGCFLSPLFAYAHYSKTVSYILGFTSFFIFVALCGRRLTLKGKVGQFINWVSKISYPLYIGHVLPGYSIMYYMISEGYNYYLAILLACLCSFAIAALVHHKVERVFRG